ncbi:hypothetical protein JHK87_040142 [Glycine soja]|nr:hypothetical protein JHK87_040142 [Glycine soja]
MAPKRGGKAPTLAAKKKPEKVSNSLFEKRPKQVVVIAHDVDPIELVVWLPALYRKMEIPYCIVKGKARLGTEERNWKIDFYGLRNYTWSYMLWIDLHKIISISVKRMIIQVQLKVVCLCFCIYSAWCEAHSVERLHAKGEANGQEPM